QICLPKLQMTMCAAYWKSGRNSGKQVWANTRPWIEPCAKMNGPGGCFSFAGQTVPGDGREDSSKCRIFRKTKLKIWPWREKRSEAEILNCWNCSMARRHLS